MSFRHEHAPCPGHTIADQPCPVGEDCTVVYGIQDDRVVWDSHMHSDIHVSHRLNIDHPESTHRDTGEKVGWAPILDEHIGHPAWPPLTREQVDELHAEAAKRGLMP